MKQTKKSLADAMQVATNKLEHTKQPVAPSRIGKKLVAGHFDPATVKQLKQIALDNDSSIQSLLGEALEDLFEKYKKLKN